MLDLIAHLEQFLLPERAQRIKDVLALRTRYITVALEDIYHTQNASAVMRTSDCFGIQDIHVIENQHLFDINPDVVLGATKWVDLHRYNRAGENNTIHAIKQLKNDGYRIVGTSPHTKSVSLEDFDYSAGKFALVFGTERHGISDTVKEMADEFVTIPMYGFTESFNLSVSAGICLHHLMHKVRNSDLQWQLSDKENLELYLKWLRRDIKNVDLIEKRYYAEKEV